MAPLNGEVTDESGIAVTGTATGVGSIGVIGKGGAVGIRGDGKTWHGVAGFSESTTGGFGVYGEGLAGGPGVVGKSKGWHAVAGFSESTTGGFGIYGEATGSGVVGISKTWIGAYGETNAAASAGAAGVLGEGKDGSDGVKGHARAQGKAGVAGFHLTNKGPGIFGKGSPAGLFEGDVTITGNLTLQGTSIQTWLQRIVQLEQQAPNVGQLVQRVSSLEQKVAALESQLNTAVSNLTGRVTQTEIAISDLKAKVQQIIQQLG